MLALNQVTLGGNLTRDPEARTIPGDRMVVHFTLAMNRRFKGPEGDLREEVTFVDCEAWGRTAELVGQYLTKGSACVVLGRLRLDQWQDKDGQKRSRLKVVAESVQFIGRSRSESAETDGATNADGEEPVATGRTAPSARRQPTRSTPGAASGGVLVDEPPF